MADPFAIADSFGLLGERLNRDAIEEMRALHERLMAADWEDQVAREGPSAHGAGAYSVGSPAQRGGRPGAAAAEPQAWPQAAEQLRGMGAVVYLPEEEGGRLGWDDMAGYDEQKRALEDLVLMSVKHAEEFERVAKLTRKDGKHHRTKVRPGSLLTGCRGGCLRAWVSHCTCGLCVFTSRLSADRQHHICGQRMWAVRRWPGFNQSHP